MSKITTVTDLPPEIIQSYSRILLNPYYCTYMMFKDLEKKWDKKFRPQDTSKRNTFNEIGKQITEFYEQTQVKAKP